MLMRWCRKLAIPQAPWASLAIWLLKLPIRPGAVWCLKKAMIAGHSVSEAEQGRVRDAHIAAQTQNSESQPQSLLRLGQSHRIGGRDPLGGNERAGTIGET